MKFEDIITTNIVEPLLEMVRNLSTESRPEARAVHDFLQETARTVIELLEILDKKQQYISAIEETHRLQLAAISVGSQCNTADSIQKHRIQPNDQHWTPVLYDVYGAVDREIHYRDQAEELRKLTEKLRALVENMSIDVTRYNLLKTPPGKLPVYAAYDGQFGTIPINGIDLDRILDSINIDKGN